MLIEKDISNEMQIKGLDLGNLKMSEVFQTVKESSLVFKEEMKSNNELPSSKCYLISGMRS